MKRKYKNTQDAVDEAVLSSIQAGNTANATLKQVLIDSWAGYTLGELVDNFARNELSGAKQRLRAKGKIEIVKGNEAKLVADLMPDEIEDICARRDGHTAGSLKTKVLFSHRNGLTEEAVRGAKALSELTGTDTAVDEIVNESQEEEQAVHLED